MKKSGLLLFIVLIAGVVFFMRQEPQKTVVAQDTKPVSEPVVSEATSEDKLLVLQENGAVEQKKEIDRKKGLRFTAASDDKPRKNDELSSYEKSQITFFDSPLFLVEGISATIMPLKGQKPIARVGGMYVYDSQQNNSYPIVYSPEKKAYGYFTGEVIVTGQFEKAINLIESKSFEVTYKNDQTEQIIFKVEHLNDLSSIEELKNLPDTKIEADVKFSRVTNI